MAYEQEREGIAQVVDKHAKVPVDPAFSAPVARSIVHRSQVLKKSPPLVVERFMDRLEPPKNINDKIGRDFHGRAYKDLATEQRSDVDARHSWLVSSESGWNPASGHPYMRSGLTFAEGHNLLIQSYRELTDKLSQEIHAALSDFSAALEKDLDAAAKAHGFYQEYSKANQALRMATAGQHRINQSTPIVSKEIRNYGYHGYQS